VRILIYKYNGNEYEVTDILDRDYMNGEIEKLQKTIKDKLVFENANATIYTKNNDITLSKGCKACKAGEWLCLFVGYRCNEVCEFCSQDKKPEVLLSSESKNMYGNKYFNDIKLYLEEIGEGIRGISYSGGEPFLYLDKVLKMSEYVKNSDRDFYQWIYTNGKLITDESCKKLAANGISEIRIDLAATNFSDKVMGNIKIAKKYFDRVTVEVPAIPETFQKLVKEKKLNEIVELGVTQLNLAELVLMQRVNFEKYAVGEDIYEYRDAFSHMISPTYSRKITYFIMQYAIKENLNIVINDCSNDTKNLQGIKRKHNLPEYLW